MSVPGIHPKQSAWMQKAAEVLKAPTVSLTQISKLRHEAQQEGFSKDSMSLMIEQIKEQTQEDRQKYIQALFPAEMEGYGGADITSYLWVAENSLDQIIDEESDRMKLAFIFAARDPNWLARHIHQFSLNGSSRANVERFIHESNEWVEAAVEHVNLGNVDRLSEMRRQAERNYPPHIISIMVSKVLGRTLAGGFNIFILALYPISEYQRIDREVFREFGNSINAYVNNPHHPYLATLIADQEIRKEIANLYLKYNMAALLAPRLGNFGLDAETNLRIVNHLLEEQPGLYLQVELTLFDDKVAKELEIRFATKYPAIFLKMEDREGRYFSKESIFREVCRRNPTLLAHHGEIYTHFLQKGSSLDKLIESEEGRAAYARELLKEGLVNCVSDFNTFAITNPLLRAELFRDFAGDTDMRTALVQYLGNFPFSEEDLQKSGVKKALKDAVQALCSTHRSFLLPKLVEWQIPADFAQEIRATIEKP